jgi:hypothetical protein
VRAWKFLDDAGRGMVSRFKWPTPSATGEPGAWVEATGPLEVCASGIHACRTDDLAFWLSAQLWEVELAGEVQEETYSLVAARGRLTAPKRGWSEAGPALADWTARRTRDRAAHLMDSADPGIAADLRAASTLAQLAEIVDRVPVDVDRPETIAVALVGSHCRVPGNPVIGCSADAQSAANMAWIEGGRDRAKQAYTEAYRLQSRWLADHLSLRP